MIASNGCLVSGNVLRRALGKGNVDIMVHLILTSDFVAFVARAHDNVRGACLPWRKSVSEVGEHLAF